MADKNIWLASSDGDLNQVKFLVENSGVNVNSYDDNSYTPMHASISWNQYDVLNYLISKGGNIDIVDDDGESPLFVVETLEMARYIVENLNANPNLRNKEGKTVSISYNIQVNFTNVVQALENFIENDEHHEIQQYLLTVSDKPAIQQNDNGLELEESELSKRIESVMIEAEQQGVDPDTRLREVIGEAVMDHITQSQINEHQ